MKNIIFIILLIAASACCPARHLSTSVSDSTRVEVRWRTEYIRDTVRIAIPAQSEKVTTREDSSHLENDYAESDARINPDGSLFPSLDTKPQQKPVPIDRPVEYRDSIVYRDRKVDVEKIVEVERDLSWWQQTQMKGFWVLAAVIVFMLRKKLLPLIRRFI